MLIEGKMLLSAAVALRVLLFVSPVFPHFGVQSIYNQINPQRVNELNAGEMKTSRDAAGPHMTQLSLTSLNVRESSSYLQPSKETKVQHIGSDLVPKRGIGYVSLCLLLPLPSLC